MKLPQPPDEATRLEALRRYAVLDTSPEKSFDDLTLLAAYVCQTPMALISLVDESRQWFKSRFGIELSETSRDAAFYSHTILRPDEVFEVRDAAVDERFASSPLVIAEPHIRFYAGAPLVSGDGHALGALCVMDRQPRALTAGQVVALQALSRHVVSQLELRRHALVAADEITERQRSEDLLQQRYQTLAANKEETDRLLLLAQRTRRALLSVLEDERQRGQELRESEERFRQLAENIEEVFWISDPDRQRILYISPAYQKVWGRTCESVYRAPQSWFDSIHPDDRRRVREASATRHFGEYGVTYRIVRPDGTVRWVHDRAFPVRDGSGNVYRVTGVAADITEQRLLEAQFRQAQKMEALGTLAGGIAHDFNNILGAIIGNIHLLKLDLGSEHVASQSIEEIERASNRAKNLVRQILAFSRQQPQVRQVVPLAPIVDEASSLLRATIPAEVEIVTTIAADVPNVFADGSQVHQVILNLCTNAWHAIGPASGRIEIQLQGVRLDHDDSSAVPRLRRGNYACLSVTDTGQGMDAAVLERIFEPFFTTKEPGRGTGLGLSVVHGIMQAHDGVIRVASSPGQGTCFRIYFPAIEAGVDVVDSGSRKLRFGAGQRILYLDDELLLANLAVRMLERLGYQVEVFTEPVQAFGAFTADPGRIDLVITDLQMPEVSGLEFARRIRGVREDIPIVLCTGHLAEDILEAARSLGIKRFLHKPSALDDFSEVLGEVFNQPVSG